MHYLFHEKNVMPSTYYNMSYGEKQIIHAFYQYEIDQRVELDEAYQRNMRIQNLLNRR